MQPRQRKELIARKHALRSGEERGEEIELAPGEGNVLPFGAGKAPQAYVELPAGEAVDADLLQAVGHRLLRLAAPQQRADAREELARRERLGEVIVGPQLEAHDAVGFVLAPGEHDDR